MRRSHGLALAGVLAVGALLRLAALDAIPPGVFYDEAANGIDALDVLGGWHPVFFPGNQGREPLHIYAIALATGLLGPGPLALRLPSAFVGIATIPASCALGREVGGRRVALLTALLVATSYWHLSLSRMAFRAVWVPLVVTLGLALALRAARTGSVRTAALAGAVGGLGLYTYLAARVVPLVVLDALVARRRGRLVLVALVATAVVSAPIGVYFLRHPDLFWERVRNSAGGELATFGRVVNAIGTFVWAGDAQARHNLPLRPGFDPIAAALFLVGLGICAVRWRRSELAVLPISGALMLLPQVLATGEPHFLRAAGALVPACAIAAIGADALLARLPRSGLVLAALAVAWTAETTHDYFVGWAPSYQAYQAFEGWGRDAGRLLDSAASAGPVAAASPLYRDRPTFYFATARQPSVAFDAHDALVLPPGGSTVLLPGGQAPAELLARLGPAIAADVTWRDEAYAPAAGLYRLDPVALGLGNSVSATVNSVFALDSYDLRTVLRPGEEQRLLLNWRVLAPAQPGLYQFAHVVSIGGDARVKLDAAPYPSASWRGGERGLTRFALPLPADLPVGAYWVATGLYATPDLRKLPLTGARGEPIGDRVLLGPFKVWDPRRARAAPLRPLGTFDEGVMLAGADLGQPSGGKLPVRLTWWAAGPTSRALTVFVHLLDPSGALRAGADAPPAGGANPTNLWQTGEMIVDEHVVEAPPGDYSVEVGLYHLGTGERLHLSGGGDSLVVGRVSVPQ